MIAKSDLEIYAALNLEPPSLERRGRLLAKFNYPRRSGRTTEMLITSLQMAQTEQVVIFVVKAKTRGYLLTKLQEAGELMQIDVNRVTIFRSGSPLALSERRIALYDHEYFHSYQSDGQLEHFCLLSEKPLD